MHFRKTLACLVIATVSLGCGDRDADAVAFDKANFPPIEAERMQHLLDQRDQISLGDPESFVREMMGDPDSTESEGGVQRLLYAGGRLEITLENGNVVAKPIHAATRSWLNP